MLADGVHKDVAFHFDIRGGQTLDRISPSLWIPFIAREHVKSAQTHGIDHHIHASSLHSTKDWHVVTELVDKRQDLLKKLRTLNQTNNEDVCFFKRCIEFSQGIDHGYTDISQLQLRALGGVNGLERIKPNGMGMINRRRIHFDQPCNEVRLISKACARLIIKYLVLINRYKYNSIYLIKSLLSIN